MAEMNDWYKLCGINGSGNSLKYSIKQAATTSSVIHVAA